jgi:hypothetical protein
MEKPIDPKKEGAVMKHAEEISSSREDTEKSAHYQEPDWFTRHILNSAVKVSTRMGLSLLGSRARCTTHL